MDRTDAELQRQPPGEGIKDGSNDGYIRNVLYTEHFGGNELCGEFRTTAASEQAIEVWDALVRVKKPLAQGKPESTEGRPWGQPLKKPAGAPLNLG